MNKISELNELEINAVFGSGNGLFATQEDAENCDNPATGIAQLPPQTALPFPL